jgi:hypothetical protein
MAVRRVFFELLETGLSVFLVTQLDNLDKQSPIATTSQAGDRADIKHSRRHSSALSLRSTCRYARAVLQHYVDRLLHDKSEIAAFLISEYQTASVGDSLVGSVLRHNMVAPLLINAASAESCVSLSWLELANLAGQEPYGNRPLCVARPTGSQTLSNYLWLDEKVGPL